MYSATILDSLTAAECCRRRERCGRNKNARAYAARRQQQKRNKQTTRVKKKIINIRRVCVCVNERANETTRRETTGDVVIRTVYGTHRQAHIIQKMWPRRVQSLRAHVCLYMPVYVCARSCCRRSGGRQTLSALDFYRIFSLAIEIKTIFFVLLSNARHRVAVDDS